MTDEVAGRFNVPRSAKAASPRGDLAAWVADLANDLLDQSVLPATAAADALDRLRWRARANRAAVWLVSGERVRRALDASESPLDTSAANIELEDGASTIEHLRRSGTAVCRFGEMSGLEALVPESVRSYVVASVISRGIVTGALVLGWTEPVPPCDDAAIGHLRIAAALLARALTTSISSGERKLFHEAVLASLPDQIAVVDRDGTILEVNAAWDDFARRHTTQSMPACGPGTSYFEVCRRAAAAGCHDAAEALAGIEAVCSGRSTLFEFAYDCHSPDENRWCTMTVTPLRHRNGGVVIAHADVTRQKAVALARRSSEEMFQRLVDSLPIPIWSMTPDGRLIQCNQPWMEAMDGDVSGDWTHVFHVDDRPRAAEALRAAASRRAKFEMELRVRAPDGTYRWSLCAAAPRRASGGSLETFVGCCCDISAKQRAESALGEVVSKLVTAQEAERGRIARELHDDVGQQVALLAAKLDGVVQRGQQSRTEVRSKLAEVRTSVQELATSIHALSHELHPAKLTLLGLSATLSALCRSVARESDIAVQFDGDEIPPDVDESSALCVLRVAQEALRNAVHHGHARTIEVSIRAADSRLTLRVVDDGAGFDPLWSQSAGIGLLSMRERVELIGGTLSVETAPARGTTIEVTVPVKHGDRSGATA